MYVSVHSVRSPTSSLQAQSRLMVRLCLTCLHFSLASSGGCCSLVWVPYKILEHFLKNEVFSACRDRRNCRIMSFERVHLCDFESVDLKVSFLDRHFEQNFCDLQNTSWSKLPCFEIDSSSTALLGSRAYFLWLTSQGQSIHFIEHLGWGCSHHLAFLVRDFLQEQMNTCLQR